jgi:hypothetical protein
MNVEVPMIATDPQQSAGRALKRLLANGPLTAVPKRPSDQQLLVALAAAQFAPDRTYREAEVNETLRQWLLTFCDPHGIDHVTLRRMLVDSRLLSRTKSGSTYRLDEASLGEAQSMSALDPARILAEIRGERASRKSSHPR